MIKKLKPKASTQLLRACVLCTRPKPDTLPTLFGVLCASCRARMVGEMTEIIATAVRVAMTELLSDSGDKRTPRR